MDRKSNQFTKSCTFKRGAWNCGSYQFNLQKNHIDQGDLCDVHYWQTQAQRPWVGLTDEEIDALHTSIKVRLMGTFDTKDIYLVVEQALKEKNT